MLPHADVHEHHPINIDAAKNRWVWRESIALAKLRDNAALMQL
ncbi:MAG TPA: hypothetical protein VFC07_11745 [Verrucomicrobiae bacterium]|nr:hypothetical protein [Verrucomicrobiae bacterium]